MFCYYHRDYLQEKKEIGDQMFCTEEEHELWADKTYGKKGDPRQTHSIEDMQKRLLEMAEEEKNKRLKGRQESLV